MAGARQKQFGSKPVTQTSERGQSRRFDGRPATSGLPRSADIRRVRRHVSNGPHPDSCAAAVCSLFDQLVGAGEKE
jgi:hypothetical protein